MGEKGDLSRGGFDVSVYKLNPLLPSSLALLSPKPRMFKTNTQILVEAGQEGR